MKKKILIVEDEPGISQSISIMLTRDGMDFVLADTSEKALRLFGGCDLIILDIGLPDENGFETLRKIRSRSKIPVIMLTARNEEIDRVAGLELGADDYVTKPFSIRELSARVRAIFRRLSDNEESSNFTIDDNKKIIYFKEKSLALSRYEYGVLCLLLSRPGHVFTREAIMNHVWDEPGESFDRSIDTMIKNIRSKIKSIDPEFDPIETRRGIGYSIKEFL